MRGVWCVLVHSLLMTACEQFESLKILTEHKIYYITYNHHGIVEFKFASYIRSIREQVEGASF